MNYDEEVFLIQFPLVKRFLYHYIYYNELHNLYKKLGFESKFWAHTIDAHILQAAMIWCMIFGSHGDQNQMHWKKLSSDQQLQDRFRKILFKKTDLCQKSWDAYWKHMLYFRNNYAAHRDLIFNEDVADFRKVPDFKKALYVAYAYDEWVREILSYTHYEEGELIFPYLEEPLFEESAEKLRKSVVPLLELLLTQTKQYSKEV